MINLVDSFCINKNHKSTKPLKCNNCQHNYSENFCANCGQRAVANKRLQFSDIISDFFDNAFNIHKGLFFTFWNLIIKPGKVGNDYITGQRKKYTNPVRFLIIAIALQAFVDYWFIHPELTEQPDFINISFLSDSVNKSMAFWNHTLATQYALIHNLTMIFIFPLVFIFLFKKLKYNFTELIAASFYYFSASLMIILLLLLTYSMFSDTTVPKAAIIIFTLSYITWTNMRFFKKVKFWKRLFKVLIALLIFMLVRVFLLVYLLSVLFPIENS